MTIQMDDASRNARLDAIESTAGASVSMQILTGSQPSDCVTADGGSVLWDVNLPADWMAGASGGSKAKSGTWSGSASGTGTAGHFRLFNSQATKDETTCFMQGAISTSGSDLNLDNTSINSGQTVTISTFTLTDGNA